MCQHTICDTKAILKLRFDAQFTEPDVNFRTTAVHHDWANADGGEEDKIRDNATFQGRILHSCASIFDDDGFTPESLEIGQSL